MERRAFLVCGPESSGNRYLVSLLCSCGCIGKSDHAQPFDAPFDGFDFPIKLPEDKPPLIAFHRSLPHGGIWPDLITIVKYLQINNYKTTVLVMVRNQEIVEKSQIKTYHVSNIFEARENIKKAFRYINILLSRITAVDFYYVTYSDLAKQTYVNWLFDQLGLTLVNPEPFVNGDEKYE